MSVMGSSVHCISVDLQAINLDNENTEKGEEALKGLMEVTRVLTLPLYSRE